MLKTSVIRYHSRQREREIRNVLMNYIHTWRLCQNVKIFYMLATISNTLLGNDKIKTVVKWVLLFIIRSLSHRTNPLLVRTCNWVLAVNSHLEPNHTISLWLKEDKEFYKIWKLARFDTQILLLTPQCKKITK